jgi:hypothetical protein
VNLPPIVVQRFVLSTGTVGWLIYRSGQLHTPIAALTDAEMLQLLRDVDWQIRGSSSPDNRRPEA